jgi:RHH-type transcriptional regulator, rel operon repressor / antitoxin RelB
MAEIATLTVRLPSDVEARLERLARTTSVSKSRLAADAIAAYLDEQERELERIREGLADAEAERVVSDEEVARWLECWGTENELPPPRCG